MLARLSMEAVELKGEDLGCVLESNTRTSDCLDVIWSEREGRMEEARRFQA